MNLVYLVLAPVSLIAFGIWLCFGLQELSANTFRPKTWVATLAALLLHIMSMLSLAGIYP